MAVGWSEGQVFAAKFSQALDPVWERRYVKRGKTTSGLFVERRDDDNCLIIGSMGTRLMFIENLYFLVVDRSGDPVSESEAALRCRSVGGLVVTSDRDVVAVTNGFGEGARARDPHVKLSVFSDIGKAKYEKELTFEDWTVPRVLVECKDGALVVGGYIRDGADTARTAFLSRVTKSGEEKWVRKYRLGERSEATACVETADGKLLVGGQISDGDRESALLMMVSPEGELEWQRAIRGSCQDHISGFTPLKSGGWIATGGTCSSGGGYFDMLFCELDAAGRVLRTATFGAGGNDYVNQVLVMDDRNVAAFGVWDSEPGDGNGWEDAVVLRLERK